jgi:hypothetical protein
MWTDTLDQPRFSVEFGRWTMCRLGQPADCWSWFRTTGPCGSVPRCRSKVQSTWRGRHRWRCGRTWTSLGFRRRSAGGQCFSSACRPRLCHVGFSERHHFDQREILRWSFFKNALLDFSVSLPSKFVHLIWQESQILKLNWTKNNFPGKRRPHLRDWTDNETNHNANNCFVIKKWIQLFRK